MFSHEAARKNPRELEFHATSSLSFLLTFPTGQHFQSLELGGARAPSPENIADSKRARQVLLGSSLCCFMETLKELMAPKKAEKF